MVFFLSCEGLSVPAYLGEEGTGSERREMEEELRRR